MAAEGRAEPDAGDYGTYARIIDWDQLSNGLLGITIRGGEIFELDETYRADSGLVMGTVRMQAALVPAPMLGNWQSLADVLHSLETHPHVQRMNLGVDYDNAWQVAFTLVQLLPLDEALKYELLGSENLDALIRELDIILNQISGED